MAFDQVNTYVKAQPTSIISEAQSVSALRELSEASAALAMTSDALWVARHNHEEANARYQSAMDVVHKARESEAL